MFIRKKEKPEGFQLWTMLFSDCNGKFQFVIYFKNWINQYLVRNINLASIILKPDGPCFLTTSKNILHFQISLKIFFLNLLLSVHYSISLLLLIYQNFFFQIIWFKYKWKNWYDLLNFLHFYKHTFHYRNLTAATDFFKVFSNSIIFNLWASDFNLKTGLLRIPPPL